MRVMKVGDAHLTYCTNIHPGESWAEVRANLEHHVLAVKARIAPDEPFGVGLRLSARAAGELDIAETKRFLHDNGLYVFTINGFPYGPFHGTPVKENVYRPDWLEDERVAYTKRLADILVALLPDGMDGSISTVPGCFKPRASRDVVKRIDEAGAYLAELEQRTGKRIVLALEPEPCCMVETIAEAIELFEHIESKHVGLCLDACHAAVEFEHLPSAIAALRMANIEIAKVQLSCGLRVAPVDRTTRDALVERFRDDVYLHQVVARRGDALVRYVDMPEAEEADEWRVHFHVPIFRGENTTQAFLEDVIAARLSTHLEVETYTWDVLPPEYRDEPIVDAVARELAWVLERLR
jgi:sugar phosphate isomerase/epimerase